MPQTSNDTRSKSYGVLKQTISATEIERAVESIRILGYAVLDGGYESSWLELLSAAFDRAFKKAVDLHGGLDALLALDENNTIRAPLAYERMFLELAVNPKVLEVCRRLIADYVVLNQQNGIINPPGHKQYNQGLWHRDLPYQHFVSSRPLALNALFCIDAFNADNGATRVLPASHREEMFPSESFITSRGVNVEATAGSFVLLDCMVFHAGGVNTTERPRRGVNHVYTIPPIRQQIDLPSLLGPDFVSDSENRRLLGYDLPTARSVTEFFGSRRRRTKPPKSSGEK